MSEQTFHIQLSGVVQGVGFRPFVYRLAQQFGLKGTVSNNADGVHIYLTTDKITAANFLHQLQEQPPSIAHIEQVSFAPVAYRSFTEFTIVESGSKQAVSLLLTPDLALCPNCRGELNNPENRRHRYGFTSCTQCGPRYSITQTIPYDRPTTTMADFALCPTCQQEYHDPADRRFFAQTNSCSDCAITLHLFNQQGQDSQLSQTEIIETVIRQLHEGAIVALKGIGGYLLLCDATRTDVIAQLRERKHRPTKPLAVLYPDLETLTGDCWIADDERTWLTGPVSPVLLLVRRATPNSGLAVEQVAPKLATVGVMLPYAPLMALIAQGFGKPLVATSGNVSGSPIAFQDDKALNELSRIADFILTHDREIVIPQDDSVIQLAPVSRQPIVLRRSRGLAPTLLSIGKVDLKRNVLALGASLKSTFSWQINGNTYVSQYLGDLESFDTQLAFQRTLAHFHNLFGRRPARLLADAHDGYFSTQLAQRLATEWKVPIRKIQHHEAHFAAVLAENKLKEEEDPVLGVVWDGTGYGTDGHIWGGEFFRYQNGYIERINHIGYFDAVLGDKMPREPRLSAFSLAYACPEAGTYLKRKFSKTEWGLYTQLLSRNSLKTSSMGRLFDAVASLLGLADVVSYEGEAALLLEEQARSYIRKHGFSMDKSYFVDAHANPHALIRQLIQDLQDARTVDWIAAKFHYSCVQLIRQTADEWDIQAIAFSGGVFQNGLLVDWLQHELGTAYRLYFHRQLSPNDECISFGQLVYEQFVTDKPLKPTLDDVLSNSR